MISYVVPFYLHVWTTDLYLLLLLFNIHYTPIFQFQKTVYGLICGVFTSKKCLYFVGFGVAHPASCMIDNFKLEELEL